jgi:hypothetical protein
VVCKYGRQTTGRIEAPPSRSACHGPAPDPDGGKGAAPGAARSSPPGPTGPDADAGSPHLPAPRGPLSALLATHLVSSPHVIPEPPPFEGDPLADDDLHLALYTCYELHYRGFPGVDERWEWEPSLIGFRAGLEAPFEAALRRLAPRPGGIRDIAAELETIVAADDGPSLSRHLAQAGTLCQYREFVVHRSAYQLKEADPHSWAIPRLDGLAKATLVALQSEEYGDGRLERMHCVLFARTMEALGLESRYGAYLDHLPGPTLATVNLMSLFGLHRRLRGAIVGHLAAFEMTSPLPNARYAEGLRRLGLGVSASDFYEEHVEADTGHQVMARDRLAAALAAAEPEVAGDILLGARALLELDGRFARFLLDRWERGDSSLRRPIDAPALRS